MKKANMLNILKYIKNRLFGMSNDNFKLAFTRDNKKFHNKLTQMGISIDSIECVGCKNKLSLDKVFGMYHINKETFFFCEKPECWIDASHKLVELESKQGK